MKTSLWGSMNNPGWLRIQFMRWTATLIRKILLLLMLIIVITLLAGVLMHPFLGHFDSYGSACWWALEHLLDPAAISGDEGFDKRVVGVILVVIGLVLLAGILLAVMMEVVDHSLKTIGEIQIPANTKDHVVIIGWNDSVPETVRTLTAQGQRHADFLNHPGNDIFILAPLELKDQSSNMRTVLRSRSPDDNPRILFGDLASDESFRLVAARDALSIFITPTLRPGHPPTVVDADSMRVAITLGHYLDAWNENQPIPRVEVSFFWGEDVDASEAILPPRFNGIVWDRIWSGMMALGLTTPEWGYAIRILIARPDPTLRILYDPRFEGIHFADVYGMLGSGVPISLGSRNSTGEITTRMPDGPEDPIRAGEVLIYMGVEPEAPFENDPSTRSRIEPTRIDLPQPDPHPTFTILSVGSNHRVQALLWELSTRPHISYRVVSVSSLSVETRKRSLSTAITEAIEMEYVHSPLYDAQVLRQTIAEYNPDTIIVSGDWQENIDSQSIDAEAAMNYLRLRQIVSDHIPVYSITYGANYSEIINQAASREINTETEVLVAGVLAFSMFQPELVPVLNSLFAGDQMILQNVVLDSPAEHDRRFDVLYQSFLLQGAVLAGYVTPQRELLVPPPKNSIIPVGGTLLIIRQASDVTDRYPIATESRQ